jgi:hypothetical protein
MRLRVPARHSARQQGRGVLPRRSAAPVDNPHAAARRDGSREWLEHIGAGHRPGHLEGALTVYVHRSGRNARRERRGPDC